MKKAVGEEKEERGGLEEGGVKSPRLFSTFSITTLALFRVQLLNDKYPGEPIHFVFFVVHTVLHVMCQSTVCDNERILNYFVSKI